MESSRRQKAIAWGISAVLHLLLFAMIALTGLFAKLSANPDKVLDVTLYELETAAAGGAEAAGSSDAESPEPAAGDDTAVTVEEKVLTQSAAVVRAVEAKAAAKAENQQTAGQESSQENGKSQGQLGKGTADKENGSKEGTGTGPGEGQGNGDGSGDRDNAAAARPSVPPRLIAGAVPDYPDGLRRQGIEGAVRVRVVVGSDGSVESATVASSSGYAEMDAAAVAAVYRYRFSAARNIYDEPVRCAVGQTVRFRLQ